MNLFTRAAEHQGCNWGMQIIDGCSLELRVATLSVASSGIAPPKKTQFNFHDSFVVVPLEHDRHRHRHRDVYTPLFCLQMNHNLKRHEIPCPLQIEEVPTLYDTPDYSNEVVVTTAVVPDIHANDEAVAAFSATVQFHFENYNISYIINASELPTKR